ncbi:MAG: universal stress protein [Rhodospirillaceae bacterium]|nr:universal stress protein [Rhodospirillaceae bacterium]
MSAVKSVLAVVGDPQSGRACLSTALRLGRQLDCHVDALHVLADPTAALPLVGEAMSGAMVDEMMGVAEREAGQRANSTRTMFDEVTSGNSYPSSATSIDGFGVSWLEESGVEEQVVALRGCRADLIVVGRPTTENETAAVMTLNAALMQSGRAVVAAPPILSEDDTVPGPVERVAVFWNGSTEATRAVQAALPLLAAAKEVTVLRVEEEEWYAGTEDLDVHLTRHGVKTVISKVLPREIRTGRSLLYAAQDCNADMMVMGAYTRSKLRQLMLGSVTGYVMEHAILPVLMCH